MDKGLAQANMLYYDRLKDREQTSPRIMKGALAAWFDILSFQFGNTVTDELLVCRHATTFGNSTFCDVRERNINPSP